MPLQFISAQIKDDAITDAKINLASGTFDFSSGTAVLKANEPVNGSDVSTKNYVDNAVTGLHWKTAVTAATTSSLPACTYANGTAGVGATLTGNANGALAAQDGVTLVQGERLLVKNQAGGVPAQSAQGIYELTTVGDGGNAFVLTRVTDMDEADEVSGAAVFVKEGTTQADTGFVCTTDAPITMGTTNIIFVQFTGAGQLSGGDGIVITGNSIAVDLVANGGLEFNGGEVQIAANGVSLEKNKMRWKYEDFTAAQDEFDIAKSTSDIPADFRAADFFFVSRNGQTQRAESGGGTPSDANGFKILVSGSTISVKLASALAAGEVCQVRYLYNL